MESIESSPFALLCVVTNITHKYVIPTVKGFCKSCEKTYIKGEVSGEFGVTSKTPKRFLSTET